MTESKICTCPSGDGSLVHPCPAHPAVEQVGGDERAAFEAAFAAMGRPVCRADYDQDAYGTPFDDGGWTGWQARAALAQPSPAIATAPTYQFHSREIGESDWAPCDFSRYLYCSKSPEMDTRVVEVTAQPSPAQAEQAEAERPEVVAYRTIGRHTKHQHPHYALNYYKQNAEDQAAHWRERGCEVSEDELMTVAQHERIVGALRAERDGAIKLLGQSVWQKIERLTQERDAALARVAELERQEPVATVAKVPGEDWNSLDFHRDLQHMQPGTKLYAAPVAQAQHSVPEKVRTLLSRAQCEIEHLAECLENVCEDEEDFDVREDVADGRVVAADIAHMLAAAPSKEGV
ncbi:TPA: hypothetical protein ACKRNP_002919 [Pseudomonas aeruginosa]